MKVQLTDIFINMYLMIIALALAHRGMVEDNYATFILAGTALWVLAAVAYTDAC